MYVFYLTGQYSVQSMTNNKKGAWKLLNYAILRLNVTNDAICKRNNTGTLVIIFLENFCATSREISQIAQ